MDINGTSYSPPKRNHGLAGDETTYLIGLDCGWFSKPPLITSNSLETFFFARALRLSAIQKRSAASLLFDLSWMMMDALVPKKG